MFFVILIISQHFQLLNVEEKRKPLKNINQFDKKISLWFYIFHTNIYTKKNIIYVGTIVSVNSLFHIFNSIKDNNRPCKHIILYVPSDFLT